VADLADLIDRGVLAYVTGKIPEALAVFRQVLEIDPDNSKARGYLILVQATHPDSFAAPARPPAAAPPGRRAGPAPAPPAAGPAPAPPPTAPRPAAQPSPAAPASPVPAPRAAAPAPPAKAAPADPPRPAAAQTIDVRPAPDPAPAAPDPVREATARPASAVPLPSPAPEPPAAAARAPAARPDDVAAPAPIAAPPAPAARERLPEPPPAVATAATPDPMASGATLRFASPFSLAAPAEPPAPAAEPARDPPPAEARFEREDDYAPSPWDEGPTSGATIVLPDETGGGLDLAAVAEKSDLHPLVPQGQPAHAPAPGAPPNDVDLWLKAAKELFALGDFTGSLELIEKILTVDPDHGEARDYLRQNEATLVSMYESKLGPLHAIPRLAIKPEEVMWLNLDHRAGFLLAQIDGTVDYEGLFAVSGLPRLDTARILANLIADGVVRS
jgi:tetratricopeptide (TPR) repeat protein